MKFLILGLVAFVGCVAIDTIDNRQIAGFFYFALGFACGMANEIMIKEKRI